MSAINQRVGYETSTGAYHRVVFDPTRAADGLPPWTSALVGQHFTDSEVVEVSEVPR